MSKVTEHNTKHEGESHYSKDCWVELFVARHPIGIHYLLESPSELIDLEECGRLKAFIRALFQLKSAFTNPLLLESIILLDMFIDPLSQLVLGEVRPEVAMEEIPFSG